MHTVFLFCNQAHSGSDGKLDIHGVLSELYAPSFPARQDHMILVGVVEWGHDTEGRIPFRIDLNDPGRQPVYSVEGHSDVELRPPGQAPAKTHLILPFNNVVFESPGSYRIRAVINDVEIDGPAICVVQSDRE